MHACVRACVRACMRACVRAAPLPAPLPHCHAAVLPRYRAACVLACLRACIRPRCPARSRAAVLPPLPPCRAAPLPFCRAAPLEPPLLCCRAASVPRCCPNDPLPSSHFLTTFGSGGAVFFGGKNAEKLRKLKETYFPNKTPTYKRETVLTLGDEL